MRNVYKKAGVATVDAEITPDSVGGFLAVASTGDIDRDGEIIDIRGRCFDPLPESIPVHQDHVMSAAGVIGRGKPFYNDGKLMLDARFASTPDAQTVRTKVRDGVLDSLSIVFRAIEWDKSSGTRTLVKGELLAADIVSVPAQPNARILSMRSFQHTAARDMARETAADALLALARAELAECKAMGYGLPGPHRRNVDALIHQALNSPSYPYRPRSL